MRQIFQSILELKLENLLKKVVYQFHSHILILTNVLEHNFFFVLSITVPGGGGLFKESKTVAVIIAGVKSSQDSHGKIYELEVKVSSAELGYQNGRSLKISISIVLLNSVEGSDGICDDGIVIVTFSIKDSKFSGLFIDEKIEEWTLTIEYASPLESEMPKEEDKYTLLRSYIGLDSDFSRFNNK